MESSITIGMDPSRLFSSNATSIVAEDQHDNSILNFFFWGCFFVFSFHCFATLYNHFTSPLRQIPGPRLATLTYFYECYYNVWKPYRYGEKIDELHQKYGPIIRVNPNEIHIHDSQFHITFLHKYKNWRKDSWYYKMGLPQATALQDDRTKHDAQKAQLVAQITTRLQRDIPSLISHHVDHLCSRLRYHGEQGREVNLSDAVRCASYDMLTALIVGDCEDRLAEDDLGHLTLKRFCSLMRYSSLQRHFPWVTGFVDFVPAWITEKYFPVQSFRKNLGRNIARLSRDGWNNDGRESITQSWVTKGVQSQVIIDECVQIVLGGTEGVGQALVYTLFLLITHPEVCALLREDLNKGHFRADMTPNQVLKGFPVLRAIIKESMRINPTHNEFRPVRVSPFTVEYKSFKLPPGTAISTSNTSSHFEPTIFPDPHSFQPERWLKPNTQEMDRHLTPFGQGTWTCPAAPLARMLLHYTVARLVWGFEFESTIDLDVESMRRDDVLRFFPCYASKGLRAEVKML